MKFPEIQNFEGLMEFSSKSGDKKAIGNKIGLYRKIPSSHISRISTLKVLCLLLSMLATVLSISDLSASSSRKPSGVKCLNTVCQLVIFLDSGCRKSVGVTLVCEAANGFFIRLRNVFGFGELALIPFQAVFVVVYIGFLVRHACPPERRADRTKICDARAEI